MREAQTQTVGALEAGSILGVSRTKLHALASTGQLPGKLIDKRGNCRHWTFKRSIVMLLRENGGYLRQQPKIRRQKQLWEQYFGPIPPGYSPAFRDGDRSNEQPRNLCLLPLRPPRTGGQRGGRGKYRIEWTPEKLAFLRQEYSKQKSRALAAQLGVSLTSLTRFARENRLRKDPAFLKYQARAANRLPLGTERVHEHGNTVWIKVSFEGKEKQQWRPKHHVIWEAANKKKVPKGYRVIFKDGDKRNFDPANLEVATREEISAKAFAGFLSCPEPVRQTIKLARKLQRLAQQNQHHGVQAAQKNTKQRRVRCSTLTRWSPAMDLILRREYPSGSLSALQARLRVTTCSMRQRARRLGIRRSPAAIVAEAVARAAAQKAQFIT